MLDKKKPPMLLKTAVINLDPSEELKSFLKAKYNLDIPETETLILHCACGTDRSMSAGRKNCSCLC